MTGALRIARQQPAAQTSSLFRPKKKRSPNLSARLAGRTLFCGVAARVRHAANRGRRLLRTATVAPVLRRRSVSGFELVGRVGGPVFHDVVPGIHRRGQQVLPVVAMPERIEIEQRRWTFHSADPLRGVPRPQEPGEKVLQFRDTHDVDLHCAILSLMIQFGARADNPDKYLQ